MKMLEKTVRTRLHVGHCLGVSQCITPTAGQINYLLNVLRLRDGAPVAVFNGRDGEWLATLTDIGRNTCRLQCSKKIGKQEPTKDMWLLFAPLKKSRTDYAVEKAVELGVSRILPVTTKFSTSRRVNVERLSLTAVEATEQCGGTSVPEVCPLSSLRDVVEQWPDDRMLVWFDERLAANGRGSELNVAGKKLAILVGPEGGFSTSEREWLAEKAFVIPASLGSRVLRAETAIVAALALINIAGVVPGG